MVLHFQLSYLLFDSKNRLDHLRCHFAETERVIILGQDSGFAGHAFEVRPEDHEAVVLEDEKMKKWFWISLQKALPDAYTDHSNLHSENDYVG